MQSSIPQSVRAVLWSYDEEKLDRDHDRNLIIFQVLNYGSEEAMTWLNKAYSRKDLEEVIRSSTQSAWSRKSLNYWSLMLGVVPDRTSRFA